MKYLAFLILMMPGIIGCGQQKFKVAKIVNDGTMQWTQYADGTDGNLTMLPIVSSGTVHIVKGEFRLYGIYISTVPTKHIHK